MGNISLILAIAQIIASVVSLVLLVAGLYASIKDIKYINKEDPADEEAHSAASFKKGMILVGCGMAVYSVARFCGNFSLMAEQGYGVAIILLQSLWEGVRDRGFLLLFPFVIRQWRRTARRKALSDK